MADWRLEDKQATLVRYGGSWSPKGMIRKMSALEAINWLSKYGYKAGHARDLKDKDTREVIGRQVDYRKAGCNTEYTMTIMF